LTPAKFYLIPRLKSALQGWRFCEGAEIIKNAIEELKGFHKMASRKVYSHRKKYIVTQEDYFKGNITLMNALF
jgi:hypothetical protein